MDQRKKELLADFKGKPLSGGVFVIRNTENGRFLLDGQTNLEGSRNRFSFAQMTDAPLMPKMAGDWKRFGKQAFVFEVLEEVTQKEDQTPEAFRADLQTLTELWAEKFDFSLSYR